MCIALGVNSALVRNIEITYTEILRHVYNLPLLLVVQTDDPSLCMYMRVRITSQDEELHVSLVPRLRTVTSYVYPTFKDLHTTVRQLSAVCAKAITVDEVL